jgi:hypothetical protein
MIVYFLAWRNSAYLARALLIEASQSQSQSDTPQSVRMLLYGRESARRRDLCLTTDNTHKRQTCSRLDCSRLDENQLDAEISTWQQTTLIRDRHAVGWTALVWTRIRPPQRSLLDNRQYSQETDMKFPGGPWTHNPSKRAAADSHVRTRIGMIII